MGMMENNPKNALAHKLVSEYAAALIQLQILRCIEYSSFLSASLFILFLLSKFI